MTKELAYKAGDNYILPHDESELRRLTVLHKYVTRVVCDDRLIYDKGIRFGQNSCVLDGDRNWSVNDLPRSVDFPTLTLPHKPQIGVWAVDLANGLNDTVEIQASDISSANFPSSHPPNVHFSIASATSLPPDWSVKFDFVHQRLLFVALLSNEWPVALSEIHRVLKPGGAVQLFEMDLRFPEPETPVYARVLAIVRSVCDAYGLRLGVAEELGALLKSAGFVEVVSEKKRLPMGCSFGELGMQGTLSLGGALRNMASVVERLGISSGEEYLSLVERAEGEWDAHDVQFTSWIAIARKPLATYS